MFPSASLFIIPIGFPPPAPFPCCIARGFFASSQRRALRDAAFRDFERPALPGETRPDAMRSPLSADRPGARTRDTPDRVTRTWAPPRSAPPRASWTNLSRRTRTRSSDAYGSTGKREKLRRPRRPFESERKRKRGRPFIGTAPSASSGRTLDCVQRANRPAAPPKSASSHGTAIGFAVISGRTHRRASDEDCAAAPSGSSSQALAAFVRPRACTCATETSGPHATGRRANALGDRRISRRYPNDHGGSHQRARGDAHRGGVSDRAQPPRLRR